MRSIATIDFTNRNNFSVLNAASQTNQLIVYMLPLSDQKSNLKIEITGSNDETFTSEILIIENGESQTFLDYEIPVQYWTLSGTMKIRLLSDEGNSEYVTFNILREIVKNSQIKYVDGLFMIENIETQSNSFPVNVGNETNISEGTVIIPSNIKTFLMVIVTVSDNRTVILVPANITGQYQGSVWWMSGHNVIVAFTWDGSKITVNRIAKEGVWVNYPVTLSIYTF